MTNRELIENLKGYDQELEVCVYTKFMLSSIEAVHSIQSLDKSGWTQLVILDGTERGKQA